MFSTVNGHFIQYAHTSRGPQKNVFDLQSFTVKPVHEISDVREETKQNKTKQRKQSFSLTFKFLGQKN